MAGGTSDTILAVSWTETAIGLVFFIARFLSNWRFVGRFRWDFAVASVTVATQLAAQIFLQLSVNAGMGRHLETLGGEQIVTALRWSWVYQLLAIGSSMLGKLAIMTFLVQIRGRHERKPWHMIILGILIIAVNITVMGTILGQCQPMAKLWDDSLDGTCDPGRKVNQDYSFFQASFNTVCDALLASYPAWLVRNLQMKLRVKISLSVLMGLGWIAAVCSAVKCYELEALTKTEDVTYAQTDLLIWASTEAWIVIIVGCVPPCRPLMEKALQILGMSSSKKSSTPHYPQRYGAYAQFSTGRSERSDLDHSNNQTGTHGANPPFDREGHAWVELASTAENNSQEHIINGSKDVVVTTDIRTDFMDAREHPGRSSDRSKPSGIP